MDRGHPQSVPWSIYPVQYYTQWPHWQILQMLKDVRGGEA